MVRNSFSEPQKGEGRCDGKLVVISGTTSGIGYYNARKYASKGANLICINRNPYRSRVVCEKIEREILV